MKFGKRLLAESSRKWAPQYMDYKGIKRSLKADCQELDPHSMRFTQVHSPSCPPHWCLWCQQLFSLQ